MTMNIARSSSLRLVASISLLAATAVTARAQAVTGAQNQADAARRLENAILAGRSGDARTVRTELLRSLAQRPDAARERLLRYTVAYAGWRLASMPDVPEREQEDLLDDAVTRLKAIATADARDAEASALLGSVYGLQIGRSPLKGMLLGPRASRALDDAADVAPDNPRVVLLQGVSAFNTPAMFGGGLGKAERLLRRSLELFAREPADETWPSWGRFDAHVWLGQALAQKGNREAARVEYDHALLLAPESRWVRMALIPALDRTGGR
jgi:tetratricopeptide (TPR) repeat protein